MSYFTSRIAASEAQSLNITAADFTSWEQQTTALAAISQSAALVSYLAQGRHAAETDIAANVNTVLVIDPGSLAEIYPNLGSLGLGFKTLQDMFSNDRFRENAELIRYTLGMLVLRNKLINNKPMQDIIRVKLAQIKPLQPVSSGRHSDLPEAEEKNLREVSYEQLARLYQDTISTLPYRIQVQGKAAELNNEQTANRIRALLLAGIRSAVLWYQLGGRRWRLVFYRKRIQETAGNIRRKLIVTD
ncbi:MAG TPA: lysogenization regulator HflD [Porticoccaceae bacterium]|nr:lysogenization regulator HflD [Porticoccaceae bacterium]